MEVVAIEPAHSPRAGGGTCPSDRCYPKPSPSACAVAQSFSVPIADGGGLHSTAAWLVPQEGVDQLKMLRRKFLRWAASWGVIPRLVSHVSEQRDQPLFSPEELDSLREALADFLASRGCECALLVQKHQPFLLDVLRALSELVHDVDSVLPGILAEGVPTGVIDPIPPSGVWEEAVAEDKCAQAFDFVVNTKPWKSGLEDVALTRGLIEADVRAGHAFVLDGGEQEARSRWGNLLASGKLGVVHAPGKKPRLIGDGSVSGANAASRISEQVRLPGLQSIQRFLSLPEASNIAWVALSFDVAGAHKQVLVREREQGLCCFVLECTWYVYRSCFFGAKWSAYWWSRVGAWIVRMLHRFIFVPHGLFLYVDDGLLLVQKSVAPLIASAALMFLGALGVPLSWRKLDLGSELVWIGWKFCLDVGHASLPTDKIEKLQALLSPLAVSGVKVRRKEVEKVIGILIWFTAGAFWLRPWLCSFYRLCQKPAAVPRLLSIQQYQDLVAQLSPSLVVAEGLRQCDVEAGWILHSVANSPVSDLAAPNLVAPRLRQGRVSCVFYNFDSTFVVTDPETGFAAQLFMNVLKVQVPIPLRWKEDDARVIGAADAFASSDAAGIGGWWLPAGLELSPVNARWFRFQLHRGNLPEWFRSKGSLLCRNVLLH